MLWIFRRGEHVHRYLISVECELLNCFVVRSKGAPTTSVFIPFQPSDFAYFVPNDCLVPEPGGEPSCVSSLLAEDNETILNLVQKPSVS